MRRPQVIHFRHVLVALLVTVVLSAPAAAQFQDGGYIEFDNGDRALGIPFELNSDKIYLSVHLNGKGPFWLVLDTGSPAMILDTAIGEALGIETGPGFEVGGAGENAFVLATALSTFEAALPGVRFIEQPAHVGGIDKIVGPFEGRRVGGVLGGHNVFVNYIVEIDYAAQMISVFDREAYEPAPRGTLVPIQVAGGHCSLDATAIVANGDSLHGTFMIDTGLRGNLVFNTPYVNENNLLERCGRTVYTTMGGGVGGQVKAHIARVNDFIFAGFSLGPIYTSLSQLERGALANENIAGIIGSAVLQRFRVVFDYAGERLILYPQEYDAEGLDLDKSGMFLVSDVEDRSVYRVIDIIAGSPAANAGLEVGDIIREIGGESASQVSLEAARRMFRRPAGTTYEIVYERNGHATTTRLTLQKIL